MRHRLAIVVVLAVIAVACSGSDDAGSTTTTSTTTTPTTTAAPTTTRASTTTSTTTTTTLPPGTPSPINGLRVEDDALLDRRVVAIKVDNHPNARPHSGINAADAVYELLVEGQTRWIALFHQSSSDFVGPIRSLRPTDPELVNFLGATLAVSGSSVWIAARARSQGTHLITEESASIGSVFKIPERRRPHGTYGNTEVIRARADTRGFPDDPPAAPMFLFDDIELTDNGPTEPASRLVMRWPTVGTSAVWEYDATTGTYLRFHGGGEFLDVNRDRTEQEQISLPTMVVIRAPRYTASPARVPEDGQPVPATDTVGSGSLLVLHGGRVITGTWQRDSANIPFELLTDDGEPLVLPRGRIWISVLPNDGSLTIEP